MAGLWGPPISVPPPLYTGSFYALETGGSLSRAHGQSAGGLDLGLRASSVLHMADVAVRYEFTNLPDSAFHGLAASAQLHPFFMFMLGSDRLWTTLASVYLRLGLGAAYLTGGTGFGGLWDWGAGLDTPVTDPDAGQSLWLGFEYRRTSLLDPPGGDPLGDSVLQSFILRAGWRFNAL